MPITANLGFWSYSNFVSMKAERNIIVAIVSFSFGRGGGNDSIDKISRGACYWGMITVVV